MRIVLYIYMTYINPLDKIKLKKKFRLKTKASVKEHVFCPKHIILFNTKSFEQFTHMFEIIKYS